MDACDVLTSLLFRRVSQSDDWHPPRLGVLDAITHSLTKGANLRNLQLRQDGHTLLASPESRLCISDAIANTIAAAGLAHLLRVSGLRQMCRSYRTRSPEWRHERPHRAVGIRNVKKTVSTEKRAGRLQLRHMQARDAAKIPQVVGPNRVAQFQGAGSDEEIRQRQNDPPGGLFFANAGDDLSSGFGHRMNGNGGQIGRASCRERV